MPPLISRNKLQNENRTAPKKFPFPDLENKKGEKQNYNKLKYKVNTGT